LEKVDFFGSGCVSARHKGSARSVRINPPRTSSCRMVEDMTVRNLSPAPQRYVHAVAKFLVGRRSSCPASISSLPPIVPGVAYPLLRLSAWSASISLAD
jgi:hypothetical protein